MGLTLAGVLLALAVALWVLAPLRRPAAAAPRSEARLDAWARRRAALAALRDLDDDRATGHLDPEAYAALRARLEAEAARVLRETAWLEEPHGCGFRNPPHARFCGGCGAPLDTAPAAQPLPALPVR